MKIVLADSLKAIRELLAHYVVEANRETGKDVGVIECANGAELSQLTIKSEETIALVTGWHMFGPEDLIAYQMAHPRVPIVVFTGFDREKVKRDLARRNLAYTFITKGAGQTETIRETIKKLVELSP